jgi:hypothetical protein
MPSISEQYIEYEAKVTDISKAEYIEDYVIKIHFEDGKKRLVDFKPFLYKSNIPDVKKYLDEKKFEKFQIIDGNLNWNNYEMIFPLSQLYEGVIRI